jgi:hypothetical protein
MQKYHQSSGQTKKAWTTVVSAIPWTHHITITPANPYLRTQEEIYRCGLSLAKRIREREQLEPGHVILFPEYSTSVHWHFHGLVVHSNVKKPNFTVEGSDYLTYQLELQAEHKYRGTQFSSATPPSVLIERLNEDATPMIHYAMKDWISQNKGETVIWF